MPRDEPTPIAIAIVIDDGRCLIGRRADDAVLGGYWEFPGGKLRAGERPDEAAERECREETGLEVRVLRELSVVEHRYEYGLVRLYFYECATHGPAIEPKSRFRWVSLNSLAAYRFPHANEAVIQSLQGRQEDIRCGATPGAHARGSTCR